MTVSSSGIPACTFSKVPWHRLFLSIFTVLLALSGIAQEPAKESEFPELDSALVTRTEALRRINPGLLESSASMQSILTDVLNGVKGHPVFVELVVRFGRTDRTEDLLAFAAAHPRHYASAEAMRYLLRQQKSEEVAEKLASTEDAPAFDGLVQLLSASGNDEAFSILTSILQNPATSAQGKKNVVRSICTTAAGCQTLINLRKQDKIPAEFVGFAAQILSLSPWDSIREKARSEFPALENQGAAGLSLSDLAAFNASVERGRQVFNDPVVGCARCHVAGSDGVRFGPELTLIGEKLSPEALLESIQSPSAGIAFGFEAWEIELDTTELFYGIIASETDDFIILRDSLGTDQKIDKSSIISRSMSSASAMPEGLPHLMSPAQLADLLAFLKSLKSPGQSPQ